MQQVLTQLLPPPPPPRVGRGNGRVPSPIFSYREGQIVWSSVLLANALRNMPPRITQPTSRPVDHRARRRYTDIQRTERPHRRKDGKYSPSARKGGAGSREEGREEGRERVPLPNQFIVEHALARPRRTRSKPQANLVGSERVPSTT